MADKIKCGKCGLSLLGQWPTDESGNGPCEVGADSPRYCQTLENRWFSANDQSLVEAGIVKPEVKADTIAKITAMLDAAGIGQETRDYWLAQATASRAADHELRRLFLSSLDAPNWFGQMINWLDQGPFDARFLALLKNLQITPNGSESMTFGDVTEWHSMLADRAAEIISDVSGYGD